MNLAKLGKALTRAAALILLSVGYALADGPLPEQPANGPGAALYADHCAKCHDNPVDRIPPKGVLAIVKTPDQIIQAATTGIMQSQATGLSKDDIKAIAIFITGKEPGASTDPDPKANLCTQPPQPIRLTARDWNGWGHDTGNTRNQAEGLSEADVPKLKMKWAFALPGNVSDAQPTIVGDRLFVTSRAGRVFALDARTGCTRWSFDAEAGVRTAPVVGPAPAKGKFAVYFATENGYLHAVDADSGKLLWTLRVEDHSATRLTGSPTLYKNRLYVPLASLEEVSVFNPKYACCTFRGGVVAVDAATGTLAWTAYTIEAEPKQIGVNSVGTPLFGPAGVTIFSSPTIDAKRNVLYVGTGNSYSQVSVDTANAIIAFDLDTGARRWVSQVLPDDDICSAGAKPDACPHTGPDFDFAAAPILRDLPDGKQILVAASKAGEVFGFDPDDKGKQVWRVKVGQGSRTAGTWGMAADAGQVFVGSADVKPGPGVTVGGLTALDAATGKTLWHADAQPAHCSWGDKPSPMAAAFNAVSCTQGQPGALAFVPGVLFSGALDGHMRAFSTKDGSLLWDTDTAQTFDAVNHAKAKGGSISYGAEAVAGGMLYVTSGAAGVHEPGNALIAYSVDGK